mmetsp:Transcript_133146/g.284628  ORF Transcript_133146/g.284628 Transcript_133146/m.284628 type:complete len:271 (-) Transcript_133146:143-955(-)
MHWKIILDESTLLIKSCPTNLMFPSILVLYLNLASTCSSPTSSDKPSGGFKFFSKESWHWLRRIRLKLTASPSSIVFFSVSQSLSMMQRQVYISMKWCCVVAFSKTSLIKISMCNLVEMPLSSNFAYKVSNFSKVNLFNMDFMARMTTSSLSSFVSCCFSAHEVSDDCSLGKSRPNPRSSSLSALPPLPPLLRPVLEPPFWPSFSLCSFMRAWCFIPCARQSSCSSKGAVGVRGACSFSSFSSFLSLSLCSCASSSSTWVSSSSVFSVSS